MLLIVHFTVGLICGILFLTGLTDRLKESTVVLLSGMFALVPDMNKFISEFGALHDSLWSNIFWFHGLIDALETGYPRVEALMALTILLFTIVVVERRV